jgi:hypothetical protein
LQYPDVDGGGEDARAMLMTGTAFGGAVDTAISGDVGEAADPSAPPTGTITPRMSSTVDIEDTQHEIDPRSHARQWNS